MNYLHEGRVVTATLWEGQPIDGVKVIPRRWGAVGEVQTARGGRWMTLGDWLVNDGRVFRVVTPAIFMREYSPVDANASPWSEGSPA
ncbi:hypothetical protein [Novosphingobium sp. HII-3]|uniref:hypothetical protein n=1 Tax=Novosphingobium sp. HII-3 TaxID=2075565 RepID=UPI000CDBA4BE|nr:hypothetical protein [Novosphingobium sp. HII-3]